MSIVLLSGSACVHCQEYTVDEHSPSPQFDEAFSQPIVDDIVKALDVAYNDAAERYEPAVGSNALTFGVDVYNFSWHRLRALPSRHPSLTATKDNNADRLHVGEYLVCSHKVGTSADADIRRSLPKNDGATTMMIEQQYLPGMEPKPEDFADKRRYVLAHLGNPDDGLGAVYLCIPAGRFGEKIEAWAYARLIWKRSDRPKATTVPEAASSIATTLPPENVVDFEVHRRRKRKTDDESPTE